MAYNLLFFFELGHFGSFGRLINTDIQSAGELTREVQQYWSKTRQWHHEHVVRAMQNPYRHAHAFSNESCDWIPAVRQILYGLPLLPVSNGSDLPIRSM